MKQDVQLKQNLVQNAKNMLRGKVCCELYIYQKDMATHLESQCGVKIMEQEQFFCPVCSEIEGLTFYTEEEMVGHIKLNHPKLTICPICSQLNKPADFPQLVQHLQVHEIRINKRKMFLSSPSH